MANQFWRLCKTRIIDKAKKRSEQMRIGVISDTHLGPGQELPAIVPEIFAGVDAILHAGDMTSLQVVDNLEKLAPVYAVTGNCDNKFIFERFGLDRVVELAGFRLGLSHGHGLGGHKIDTPASVYRYWCRKVVDVAVFGHTHIPYCAEQAGMLLFNPGSITLPRGGNPPSVGLLSLVAGEKPTGQIIKLPGISRG